jgi:hypothetical protein
MPEDKKVSYAVFNLLNDAQLWFYFLELNGDLPTWNRFVRLVNTRFGPSLTDIPIGELAHLRRDGTVEEYCTKFVSLACREPTLSEGFQVQLFVAGLGEPLRTDITLHQPAIIDKAVKFARAHKQRAAYTTPVPPPPSRMTTRSFACANRGGGQPQHSASTAAPSSCRQTRSCPLLKLLNVARRAIAFTVMICLPKAISKYVNISLLLKYWAMRKVTHGWRRVQSQ